MVQAMISLRSFAKLANVSPPTVSRAFSEESSEISPETKARILELAESCGFSPANARPARLGGSTRSIGITLYHFSTSTFVDIFRGAQKEAAENGYLLIAADSECFGERSAVNRLVEHSVDALILMIVEEKLKRKDFQRLLNFKGPITLIETKRMGFDADFVSYDDFRGGQLAAEHLLSLGHRRIGFGYYGEGQSTCDVRFDGFKAELQKAGLEFDPSLMATLPPRGPDVWGKVRENIKSIFSLPAGKRPTAFFAATDHIAVEAYRTAESLGMKIPEDISIVGFADLNYASLLTPALTTIRQNGFEMGRQATKFVLERLKTPNLQYKTAIVPVELVVRKSTSKPKQ